MGQEMVLSRTEVSVQSVESSGFVLAVGCVDSPSLSLPRSRSSKFRSTLALR